MADSITSEKQNAEQNELCVQVEKEKPISMHEDIPVWYDCCSCEAEPYWLEAMVQAEAESGKQNH
jgi:hypothetical protein